MKIKSIISLVAVLSFSLSSCSESSTSPISSTETTTSAAVTSHIFESSSDTGLTTTASETEPDIGIDLSMYGSNARFYSDDDIYVEWIDVGYVEKMPDRLMITDRIQLEYAKIRYPLNIPDDADEDTRYFLDNSMIEPFEEMTEKYPVEKYTYLLEYVRANGGGYHIIPSGIVISDDRITFINSPDSKYPEWADTYPDVCSDYCYMSAVPKEYLISENYPGWYQPDEDSKVKKSSRTAVGGS